MCKVRRSLILLSLIYFLLIIAVAKTKLKSSGFKKGLRTEFKSARLETRSYSEPYQISKMERFVKIFNGF